MARRLVTHRLDAWGHRYGSDANDAATLVVGELAANAVRHGRVRGRDFRVRLLATGDLLRVEVLDARGERSPVLAECPEGEGGRGLLLVEALTERWGSEPRPGGVGKVVWAELRLPGPVG